MKNAQEVTKFSNIIRNAKNKLGLNHTQMGEFLGFSRETVLKWYRGDMMPGKERQEIVMKKLTDAGVL